MALKVQTQVVGLLEKSLMKPPGNCHFVFVRLAADRFFWSTAVADAWKDRELGDTRGDFERNRCHSCTSSSHCCLHTAGLALAIEAQVALMFTVGDNDYKAKVRTLR